MYFSIYNDKKFDISKIFLKNLINSYHFSNTVRTPPNRYQNNFIGELKGSKKPAHDTLFWSTIKKHKSSSSFRHKNCFSFNKRLTKKKVSDIPSLLSNNNNINYKTNKRKNKCILTNEILNKDNDNNGNDIGIINLIFPYCKPKLKYSHSNIYIKNKNKNKNKNKFLRSTYNINKTQNRLFMKSLSNFHQIINKSEFHKHKGDYL